MSLADYEPMPVHFTLPISIAVIGIIIPTAIYMLEAAHKVSKLLKKDTVEMLNGNADGDSRTRHVLAGKKGKVRNKFALRSKCSKENRCLLGKVRNKFALRSILANPGRSFVVFLGAFLGALMITVAFMFIDSINNVIDRGADSMGSFKYEYVLNRLKTDEVAGADELVIGKYEHDGSSFSLIGADTDVKYLNIDTEDGSRADLSNGYYVTNVMAYAYKLEAGDEFTFVNPITMEEKKVTISGIIMNDSQKLLVCSQNNARKLLVWDDGTYNGLLSEKKLDLGDEISKTVTSDDIREQMKTILTEMGAIIYSLAVIGAIICIAALYVSVNMLISENRHNISMLKVLGLKNREINRMIIDVNHIIIPFGIAVGLLTGYFMMVVVFRIYSGMEGVLYTPVITAQSIILTIVIVIACYAVSLLTVRRKADRVDMVESLKDNRE
jgi:putative ABC transport system permease protein